MENEDNNIAKRYLNQKYAVSDWASSQRLKGLHADMILYLGGNGYVDAENMVSVKEIMTDNSKYSASSISNSLSDLWRMNVIVKKVLAEDQRGKWLNLTGKGNQFSKDLEDIISG